MNASPKSVAEQLREAPAIKCGTPSTMPHDLRRVLMRQLLDFAYATDQIISLKHRWLDEREYEDFEEYRAILTKLFSDAGYLVHKITKSFNIFLTKDNEKLELRVNADRMRVFAGWN